MEGKHSGRRLTGLCHGCDRLRCIRNSAARGKRTGSNPDTAPQADSTRCPRLADTGHGRWYFAVQVTAANGRRARVRRGGYPSLVEAEQARQELLGLPDATASGRAWTMQRWLEQWLASVRDQVRPSTARGYRDHMRHYLIPHLGKIRLASLRTAQVQATFRIIASGKTQSGRLLASSTLEPIRATLRSALSEAIRQGLINANPAVGVRLPKPRRVRPVVWTATREAAWRDGGSRPLVSVWTRQHLATFLGFVKDDPLFPLWWLVSLTGLRRGEVTALRWSDIGIRPEHIIAVPYPGGVLPAYRFSSPHRGTVVLFGGFDSYLEEFLPMMLALARGGYQVIGFEGSGQGGALEDHGLPLTPHWHRPVGAVLDHFGLDRVTLVGISLGGGLADFLAVNLRQVPPAVRAIVRTFQAVRAYRLLDAVAGRRSAVAAAAPRPVHPALGDPAGRRSRPGLGRRYTGSGRRGGSRHPAQRWVRVHSADAGRAGCRSPRRVSAGRRPGEPRRVPVGDCRAGPGSGEVLIVAGGDRLCADARIIDGALVLDLSALTGESVPVSRAAEPADPSSAVLDATDMVLRHHVHRRAKRPRWSPAPAVHWRTMQWPVALGGGTGCAQAW